MAWVCAEKHNKATAHYYENGAALCGRVANMEVDDAEGMAQLSAYACKSCKQKLAIRDRERKAKQWTTLRRE